MIQDFSGATGHRPYPMHPSGAAGRWGPGIAAVPLAFALMGSGSLAITSPILLKSHHVAVSADGMPSSPAAFTASAGEANMVAFQAALREMSDLSEVLVTEGEMQPINQQTLNYAIQLLCPLVLSMQQACSPMMLPLQGGGVGAEWHDFGLNIELRFRNVYDVYAEVEDARGIISEHHGRDPHLRLVQPALREFSRRSLG